MHLLFEETRRHKKLRKLFETFCGESDLFFELASRADFGRFTIFERPCRNLQQITHGGMTILPNECNSAIVKHGYDHSASEMVNDFALIRELTFADGIDCDSEPAAVINFLAVDYPW